MEQKQLNFWQKTKKLIREVGIIVLGVTISIWFTDKYNHYKEQGDVKTFLRDLREGLKADTVSMNNSKNKLLEYRSDNLLLENLTEAIIDSVKKVKGSVNFKTTITTTKINVGDYEGFKSSGRIGTIENKNLKKMILRYYQDDVPTLAELERYSKERYVDVFDYMNNNADKELRKRVTNPKFKSVMNTYNETASEMIGLYSQEIKNVEEIITEIDKEVGK
jgi:uncharacterized protein (UPF0210 family)